MPARHAVAAPCTTKCVVPLAVHYDNTREAMVSGTGRRWPTVALPRRTLCAYAGAPTAAWRAWPRQTPSWADYAGAGPPWQSGGSSGATPVEALANPAWVPSRLWTRPHACSRLLSMGGAPPRPASDASVGQVCLPVPPRKPRQAIHRSGGLLDGAPGPPGPDGTPSSWYVAPSWCASVGGRCPLLPRSQKTRLPPRGLHTAPPCLVAAWKPPRVGLDGNCCACSGRWTLDPYDAGSWRMPRGWQCDGRGAALAGTRRPQPSSWLGRTAPRGTRALLVFVSALLLLDLVNALGLWRLGRHSKRGSASPF